MFRINKSKQSILITTMLACLGSTAVHAEDDWDATPEDTTVTRYVEGDKGMAKGAVFGAILGGPPGLFIGALTGKLMGRHEGMERKLNEKDSELTRLQASLARSQQRIATLQQQSKNKKLMVASLGSTGIQSQLNIGKLLQDNFLFTVNFKTDSDHIERHLETQIRNLGKALRQVSGVRVRLQGYADMRGASEYNMSLSQKRVKAVKSILLQEGLASNLIVVSARGEDSSLELGQDQDSLAFDRRVVISFEKTGE